MIKNVNVERLGDRYHLRMLDLNYYFTESDLNSFSSANGRIWPSLQSYLACRQLRHKNHRDHVETLKTPYDIRRYLMHLEEISQESPFNYPNHSLEEVKELTRAYGYLLASKPKLQSRLVGMEDKKFVHDLGNALRPHDLFYGAVLIADNWIGLNVVGKIIGLYQRRLRTHPILSMDDFIEGTVAVIESWYLEKGFIVK